MRNPLAQLDWNDLRHRTSLKWRRYPPDVLPMWIAEMDVLLAKPIVRAIEKALALGDTGYATGTAYAPALAEFARRRWGWSADPARTAPVADVMRGVVEVLRLVTRRGDAVVLNPPAYPPFFAFVTNMDRRIVTAPLGPDGRLALDVLESTFAEATRDGRPAAYLLGNPHNPTGTVHTRAELAAVAALAARFGVRVVADEIHAPLVHPGATFTPYLSVPGTDDAFAVLSASKAWNLPGIRCALVVASGQSYLDLAMLPEEVSHGLSHLGEIAHVAALRDGQEWLDALLAGLDHNRRLLAELLAKHVPEIGYRIPEGTYLAWLDCTRLDLLDPAALFLERGRVAVTPGYLFGTGGDRFVRLNFATSPKLLEEGVRRLARALG